MNIVRRTVEIDASTDARLTEMAAERIAMTTRSPCRRG
jgi:hypothetical protein